MHTGKCDELTSVLVSLGPVKRSTARVKSQLEKEFPRGRAIFSPQMFGNVKKLFIYLHKKYIDMNFKPSGSWIVLPDPVITETESGIILDEATAMENSKRSNVLEALAVGPHCNFVEQGDTVMVDPRSEAARTEIDGKLYLIISEHQILGKW